MHNKFAIITIFHALIYRFVSFAHYEQKFSTFIYIRNFFSGLFYDLVFIFSILTFGLLLQTVCKRKSALTIFYSLALIVIIGLNLMNFYMSTYFPDGLATWGMLIEYAREAKVLAGTGAGMCNPIPGLLLLLPLTAFFLPLKKHNHATKKLMLCALILMISVIGLNFAAKKIRVNKHHILGDNTIFRIFDNDKQVVFFR